MDLLQIVSTFVYRYNFQAAVVSILLYVCTTWTLTKRMEKKLDGNYTRMLQATLKMPRKQHPTKHEMYGHLPPITKTIQVRRTRHARHCWRSRVEPISDIIQWTPSHGRAKADDQLKPSYNCSVQIQDVDLKTYRKRWTIEKDGERGSEISVLVARHDDDDDDDISLSRLSFLFIQCLCIN